MSKLKSSVWSTILASGILYGLAYPNYPEFPFGVLAWFALVPLLLEIKKTSSFKAYLSIILPVFAISSPIGFWWTSYYSWQTFFVCYFTQLLSLYFVFVLHFGLQKRFGWRRSLILFPFLWVFVEWTTHLLPHNLQVLNIAYTQAHLLYFNQFADLAGIWGIAFWVISLNVLITLAIETKAKKYYLFTTTCVLLALIYSVWILHINPSSAIGSGNTKTKVALIQTNIDSYAVNDSLIVQKTLNQIISLSDSAVRTHKPDLVVLPEASFPFSLFKDKSFLDFARRNIVNWNTNVAIGYVNYEDSTSFKNLALVFTPQLAYFWDSLKIKEADIKIYQKEFGLPFIEFMPYCKNCNSLKGRRLIKGSEPYTFLYANTRSEKFKVALSICWEQTYPNKIASLVRDGAEYITMMNNDSWFGKTPGAKYLLSFTKLRAIENRRAIARCSNGGISCFIDPFGKIYGEIPWFTANISSQDVLAVNKKSFYTKHPNFFVILICSIMVGLILYFWIKK
ncbi:MAG: apolipoprotein N-acyltransferase [Spirosomataceae bacterium]